jgi:pimeloyl-ACP methyl ester carboxylesterase
LQTSQTRSRLARRLTAALFATVSLASSVAAATPGGDTRFVTEGGRKLAFHITPGGPCALVLDAGGGFDSSYWTSLTPQLASATGCKVITYDRAGVGASDEATGPWNVVAASHDLAAVMSAARATHDVILVSHSLAGEIAFYLAKEHPQWLRGAVLVDANVPEFYTDAVIQAQTQAFAPMIAAAKSGPSTPASRQLLSVAASFADTSKAFHAQTWPKAIPVVVIVSEKTPFDDAAAAQLWRAAHQAFADAAANRSLVVAAGSSHDVARDRPDVILGAVKALLGRQPH